MGRKSKDKGGKKNPGKELSRFQLQTKKALASKLLKMTSFYQPTFTPAKNWEHFLELESIVNEIRSIENHSRPKPLPTSREENLEKFLAWLKENGAEFDGLEVSSFEGYDFGLKAKKDFKEGSLMLTVPRKVMISDHDARQSYLADFIMVDPLLQNMANVTLALFLLMEKHRKDSFYKPYLDVLPETYSTILYYTSEELSYLKPSPTLEGAIKLYRSIARQYAYFFTKLQEADMTVTRQLAEYFTYDNYKWAVSSVMTRQNNVSFGDMDGTAFIPLWDMCNHEQGRITTDYNKELDRGECFALRDFAENEQVFIFYGPRSNSDLFIHNGFVYPNNLYDSLSIPLGISQSDSLKDKRLLLLAKLGLKTTTPYNMYNNHPHLSPELLAFVRIFNMTEEQLDAWLKLSMPSDLISMDKASALSVGLDIDTKAFKYLLTRCKLMHAGYTKTPDEACEETPHYRNIRIIRDTDEQILSNSIKFIEKLLAVPRNAEKPKTTKAEKEKPKKSTATPTDVETPNAATPSE